MITAMKKYHYSQAPLPFVGQKRMFASEFRKVLKRFSDRTVFVDLFGGSGLLSHITKRERPDATVIYNDHDNYRERLENISRTNALLSDLRRLSEGIPRHRMLSKKMHGMFLERIRREESTGFVDYLTISSSLLFSGKYARNIGELGKLNFYNNMRLSDYCCEGYLDGLEVVCCDYRELVDLASIRTILDDPAFDRQAALQSHLAELEARRARLDDLILTVQRTVNDIKGGTKMTDQEKFEAFKRRTVEANETAFGQEIREKYGDEEMDRANACVLALTQEEYAQWKSLGGEIHTALVTAVKAGADPAGPEGQRIAALHRRWLSYSWESYTPQAHVGLAELYVSDPRFTAYYDREVPGCAAFLRDAVRTYTGA